MHAGDVREGEIAGRNRLTGQIKFNWTENDEEREQKPVVGYFSYFKLKDGTDSTLYMTVSELRAHASRYSQAYKSKKKDSPWNDEHSFGIMCMKTVTKLNISRNGVMSITITAERLIWRTCLYLNTKAFWSARQNRPPSFRAGGRISRARRLSWGIIFTHILRAKKRTGNR
jgi:hypothetical protein